MSQIDDLCKILIVVLCIVKNCTLYAQGYFNNTYYYLAFDSLNRTESYGGVVELPLNNYLAGGNSWNYLNGSTKLLFDKVDETGELVFQKAYGDTGDFLLSQT
ncbi:MAG: hypothetical protein IPI62_07870 [Bacteroidetes bacterium]|nr:hypothetical protein [Bacteroidota bacterium]